MARRVAAGSDVLELGAATGYLTRYLREARGCRVDIVEGSRAMAEEARRYARRAWVEDLDRVSLLDLAAPSSYDFVVAADVLEHLGDPGRILRECAVLLRSSGRLLASLPNVGHAAVVLDLMEGRFAYRESGLLDRTHRWFFTRTSALALLRENGFAVDTVERITRMPETTEFGRSFDAIPPDLRDYLLRHPDALAYQLVFDARVGILEEAEWQRLATPTEPAELVFPVKAYWAGPEEEFSEERHVAGFGRIGVARQRIELVLPPRVSIARLRIDPTDRPGCLRLYGLELRVRERAGGRDEPRLVLSGPEDFVRLAAFHEMEPRFGATGATFLVTGWDPFLRVDLDRPLDGMAETRLSLELSWPISEDFRILREALELRAAKGGDEPVATELPEGRLTVERAGEPPASPDRGPGTDREATPGELGAAGPSRLGAWARVRSLAVGWAARLRR